MRYIKIESIMRKSLQKGFTLIELLVVVAIIGLLASIVIASLNSARQKGRDARRIADVRDIQTAMEMYNDSNNGYPGATSSLAPTYISLVPVDPVNSGVYQYKYAPTAPGSGVNAPCPQYHFGTTLEVSGNASLSSAAHAAAGTGCNSATDFDASGAARASCGGATTGSTNQCYDVKVQ